jgi:hypothetical protein
MANQVRLGMQMQKISPVLENDQILELTQQVKGLKLSLACQQRFKPVY